MTMPKLKKRILEIGNRECYNKGNRGEKSMKIIMRADDLGFSEAVNHGICKAVKDGVITSVGMMPNMKAARHGYELIKDMDIALGQHTNICVGRPLMDPKLIPSLVNENGEFCSSREIRNRKEDTIDIRECELEIEAQYKRFREITGKDPDYFECHAIFSSNFFTALKNVADRYRLNYENILFDQEYEEKSGIHGIPMAKLDKNNLYNPRDYMNENVKRVQQNGCSVFVFHPGYLDQYILTHSSFTLIRAMECEFLCSDWLRDWIKDHHFELTDFRKMKDE